MSGLVSAITEYFYALVARLLSLLTHFSTRYCTILRRMTATELSSVSIHTNSVHTLHVKWRESAHFVWAWGLAHSLVTQFLIHQSPLSIGLTMLAPPNCLIVAMVYKSAIPHYHVSKPHRNRSKKIHECYMLQFTVESMDGFSCSRRH